MLKLTDSLKTGSRVFFLIVVFFVLIGFSKCTNVIFTNGSAKKTCVQKIMFRIVNKYIHSFFFFFFFFFFGRGEDSLKVYQVNMYFLRKNFIPDKSRVETENDECKIASDLTVFRIKLLHNQHR